MTNGVGLQLVCPTKLVLSRVRTRGHGCHPTESWFIEDFPSVQPLLADFLPDLQPTLMALRMVHKRHIPWCPSGFSFRAFVFWSALLLLP